MNESFISHQCEHHLKIINNLKKNSSAYISAKYSGGTTHAWFSFQALWITRPIKFGYCNLKKILITCTSSKFNLWTLSWEWITNLELRSTFYNLSFVRLNVYWMFCQSLRLNPNHNLYNVYYTWYPKHHKEIDGV